VATRALEPFLNSIVHIHSFAEDNLKYVVLDLLSSGRETTATTIQWAVLFLVNHPEVQENIRIERTENTSEDCSPQLSEKSHFPYCEAVMTESQRLGNILPMSLRNTASDDVKVEGYRIPKGALVKNECAQCYLRTVQGPGWPNELGSWIT
jgi:cytochrome P450